MPMKQSLPPIPGDLWPNVIAVSARRPEGRMLALEIPGLSESILLTILCRAVYHEMRSAGEWTARINPGSKPEYPSEKDFARHSAENAARLLAIYTALFGLADYTRDFDPTPADLKSGATRSYQMGLRDERKQQADRDPAPALSSTSSISARPKSNPHP
jgi:hypothetical protein